MQRCSRGGFPPIILSGASQQPVSADQRSFATPSVSVADIMKLRTKKLAKKFDDDETD